MTVARWLRLALAVIALGLADARMRGDAGAQTPPATGRATTAPASRHGTPKSWRFTWPSGDSAKGRAVFQKLECYSCHEVRGERFPAPTDRSRVGPELSAMAPLHPPEYLAEAIINPGAVIEPNHGYAAPDGSSKMPSYADSLTVQEAIDLVAYLRQLRSPGPSAPTPGGHSGHASP
jgi:mono/diheme cytochrome c family protein